VSVSGDCPETAPGRTSVTIRSVDELIATRSATPVFDEETGEWVFEYELEVAEGELTCVQTRRVHHVDADGIRLRMDLAREYQLDGVSLWALGFDDQSVWDAILPTITDPTLTDPTLTDPTLATTPSS
jgi:spore germination protein YaaH